MPTLQEGIEFLYQKAIVEKKSQSPIRMRPVADYCIEQLALRGLDGCLAEQPVRGHLRTKQWDVAYHANDKHLLAISLKSILTNLSGTVPNRGDDLMGEAANIQLWSPEIVTGYLMVFNTEEDAYSKMYQSTWCDLMKQRLGQISGRQAPSWGFGMVESTALVQVDFSNGPQLLTPESEVSAFLDELVAEVTKRNPSLSG
jgi:hypothetical protein